MPPLNTYPIMQQRHRQRFGIWEVFSWVRGKAFIHWIAVPERVFNGRIICFPFCLVSVLKAYGCLAHIITPDHNYLNFPMRLQIILLRKNKSAVLLVGEVVPKPNCFWAWRLPHSQTLGPRNMLHNDLDLHGLKRKAGESHRRIEGVGPLTFLARSRIYMNTPSNYRSYNDARNLSPPDFAITTDTDIPNHLSIRRIRSSRHLPHPLLSPIFLQ